ncbi:hypothetical protein BURPSS13_Q0105 [Burkholderia pseudomallei S13]|nr:hypothetical protein BURPSS13_Q0105 [Burkholderia pseudomallei S13]
MRGGHPPARMPDAECAASSRVKRRERSRRFFVKIDVRSDDRDPIGGHARFAPRFDSTLRCTRIGEEDRACSDRVRTIASERAQACRRPGADDRPPERGTSSAGDRAVTIRRSNTGERCEHPQPICVHRGAPTCSGASALRRA